MPTSLVTGGAGFLGSHLCDYLISRGQRVICVDNLETGSLENIRHLKNGSNFRFEMFDITSHYELDEPVDFVYHMASPASPIDYARLPLHTLKVGAYGTHNTLGLAKKHRARFLLASTSEVYGDPLVHPQPETYWGNVNPIGPRGVYDEAKRYAEALTMAYFRQQGVDTAIVRIFNTFGPRMRPNDGRAIPAFLGQALADRPVTVFGEGSQTRSFCYVDDLIRGLVLLSESEVHEPVNIGNPNEMSLLEMAKLIIELTESRSEIVFEALPVDDPQVRQPDITRARELLGWEPEIDVRDGIGQTIEHYTKLLGARRDELGRGQEPRGHLEGDRPPQHHVRVAGGGGRAEPVRGGPPGLGLDPRPRDPREPGHRDGLLPHRLRPRGRAARGGGDGRGGGEPDGSRRVDASSLILDDCPSPVSRLDFCFSASCRYISSSRNRRRSAGKGSVSTSRAFVIWQ